MFILICMRNQNMSTWNKNTTWKLWLKMRFRIRFRSLKLKKRTEKYTIEKCDSVWCKRWKDVSNWFKNSRLIRIFVIWSIINYLILIFINYLYVIIERLITLFQIFGQTLVVFKYVWFIFCSFGKIRIHVIKIIWKKFPWIIIYIYSGGTILKVLKWNVK